MNQYASKRERKLLVNQKSFNMQTKKSRCLLIEKEQWKIQHNVYNSSLCANNTRVREKKGKNCLWRIYCDLSSSLSLSLSHFSHIATAAAGRREKMFIFCLFPFSIIVVLFSYIYLWGMENFIIFFAIFFCN